MTARFPLRASIACAALLTAIATARAHDLWIEPSTFHPSAGEIVKVHLWVGQNFVGDPVPRQSNTIEQFFVGQGGAQGNAQANVDQANVDEDIEGSNNIDPAGFLRAGATATAVIGYRSTGSFIELRADKFEDYLRLYGLDAIIAERSRRGEQAKPGKERFFRYAKALLTGGRASFVATQALGFAYEIVPDSDPTREAGPFRGRVIYDGKPLGGALVEAFWRDDPTVKLSARADAQGAFAFTLPRPGVWLVKSVHMVRAGFFASSDWDSLWASLTFDAPKP